MALTQKELEIVRASHGLLEGALRFRDDIQLDRQYDTWEGYYEGMMWRPDVAVELQRRNRDIVSVNLIKPTLRQLASFVTARKPKIRIQAEGNSKEVDREFAEQLTAVIGDVQWQLDNEQAKFRQGTRFAMKFGDAFYEPHNLSQESGDEALPQMKVYGPRHVVVDPAGVSPHFEDHEWYMIVEPVQLAKLRREYGKRAEVVKAGEGQLLLNPRKRPRGKIEDPSPEKLDVATFFRDRAVHALDNTPDSRYGLKRALLIRLFLRDAQSMEDYGFSTRGQRREMEAKYPHGRVLHLANGELLRDEALPPWNPYPTLAHQQSEPTTDKFYASSDVKDLKPPQDDLTQIRSLTMEYMAKVLKVIAMVPRGANIRKKDLLDMIQFEYDPHVVGPGGVHMLNMPSLPSAAFQMEQVAIGFIQLIGGVQEVLAGSVPGRVESGEAIGRLQTAAGTPLVDRVQSLVEVIEFVVRRQALALPMMRSRGISLGDFEEHFRIRVDEESLFPVSEQAQAQFAFNMLVQLGRVLPVQTRMKWVQRILRTTLPDFPFNAEEIVKAMAQTSESLRQEQLAEVAPLQGGA